MTTQGLAAWATDRGATPGAARVLARVLVGRFAGRKHNDSASVRLVELARRELADDIPAVVSASAADGTARFAVHLSDGELVESVVIPHGTRTTVCLSTQVGCARACVFCETGRLGLARQLATQEITGQFAAVARWLARKGKAPPTNVVFMGMGEPLDNLDAVLAASAVLVDPSGFAIAEQRITVSTVGVVPKLRELYARSKQRVAVSLHVANDAERAALLPIARAWDLAALRGAIAASPRTVLLQWTLIEGKNDSLRHANELLAFCEGLAVRINLIPLNPGPDDSLRAPTPEHVRAFQKRLADAGLRVMVRLPHGQEVGGACGQLAGALRETPERRSKLPIAGRARL